MLRGARKRLGTPSTATKPTDSKWRIFARSLRKVDELSSRRSFGKWRIYTTDYLLSQFPKELEALQLQLEESHKDNERLLTNLKALDDIEIKLSGVYGIEKDILHRVRSASNTPCGSRGASPGVASPDQRRLSEPTPSDKGSFMTGLRREYSIELSPSPSTSCPSPTPVLDETSPEPASPIASPTSSTPVTRVSVLKEEGVPPLNLERSFSAVEEMGSIHRTLSSRSESNQDMLSIVATMRKEASNVIAELQDELEWSERAEQYVVETAESFTSLREENARLLDSCSERDSRLRSLQIELVSLTAELSDAKQKIEQLEATSSPSEEDLEESRAEHELVDVLEKKVANQVSLLRDEILKEIKTSKSAEETMQKVVREKEVEVASLKAQINGDQERTSENEDLRKKLDDAERLLAEKENMHDVMAKRVEAMESMDRAMYYTSEAELMATKNDLDDAKEQVQEMNMEARTLHERIGNLTTLLESKQKTIEDQKLVIQSQATRLESVNQEIVEIREDLGSRDYEIDSLSAQLEVEKTNQAVLKANQEEIMSQLRQLVLEKESLNATIQPIMKKLQEGFPVACGSESDSSTRGHSRNRRELRGRRRRPGDTLPIGAKRDSGKKGGGGGPMESSDEFSPHEGNCSSDTNMGQTG